MRPSERADSRGDAGEFHVLGGTPFRITPYRYQEFNTAPDQTTVGGVSSLGILECSLPGGSEVSMRSRPAKKAVRVAIFVVVIVVPLALPIWLGTGPVLLSP